MALAIQLAFTVASILIAKFSEPARDAIVAFGNYFCKKDFPRIPSWNAVEDCGLNVLHDLMLNTSRPDYGESLWVEMSQRIGGKDVAASQSWMQRVVAFLQDEEAMPGNVLSAKPVTETQGIVNAVLSGKPSAILALSLIAIGLVLFLRSRHA